MLVAPVNGSSVTAYCGGPCPKHSGTATASQRGRPTRVGHDRAKAQRPIDAKRCGLIAMLHLRSDQGAAYRGGSNVQCPDADFDYCLAAIPKPTALAAAALERIEPGVEVVRDIRGIGAAVTVEVPGRITG